jgi:hypothetical protein
MLKNIRFYLLPHSYMRCVCAFPLLNYSADRKKKKIDKNDLPTPDSRKD